MTHRIHTTPNGLQLNVGGRRRPTSFPARSMLSKYICKSTLPTPPATLEYDPAALVALSDSLANDRLANCTAAGACHLVEAITAAAGSPVTLSAADAVAFYELSTGYNPHDPSTDRGGNELDVLHYWRDHGLDGKGAHAIDDFVGVDPHDPEMTRIAAWLFGLYFGCELPDAWLQIEGGGFVWKPGRPDFNNGHCFMSKAYTKDGPEVDSWGLLGTITDAAVSKLCDARYYGQLTAVLTREAISAAKNIAPSGFDFDQLEDDLKAIAA